MLGWLKLCRNCSSYLPIWPGARRCPSTIGFFVEKGKPKIPKPLRDLFLIHYCRWRYWGCGSINEFVVYQYVLYLYYISNCHHSSTWMKRTFGASTYKINLKSEVRSFRGCIIYIYNIHYCLYSLPGYDRFITIFQLESSKLQHPAFQPRVCKQKIVYFDIICWVEWGF